VEIGIGKKADRFVIEFGGTGEHSGVRGASKDS
jgi:hypothetical protein